MGVPSLFRKLVQTWPEIIFPAAGSIQVDNLYFDLNCLIHPCAQRVIAEYRGKPRPELSDLHRAIFKSITDYTTHITKLVKPEKLVYLSVDGVAPMAKQLQQRERRYKSGKLRKMSDAIYETLGLHDHISMFDTNCITPGTKFMSDLNVFLEDFLKKHDLAPKAILSGSDVPGEGEHKVMSYIRKHHAAGDIECVYGLDADLIFLTMMCEKPGMHLIRERVYFTGSNENSAANTDFAAIEFDLMSIDRLRQSLEKDARQTRHRQYLETNLVRDFTFLCFLLGNDFLPHLPSLTIKYGGMDILQRHYFSLLQSQERHLILADLSINMSFLRELLRVLSFEEDKNLADEHHQRCMKRINPQYTVDAEKSDAENSHHKQMHAFEMVYQKQHDTVCPGKRGWKFRYYDHHFGVSPLRKLEYDDTRKSAAETYLNGLIWVWQYYTGRLINWDWAYTLPAAPCISDLSEFCVDINKISFGKTTPRKPFEQLMSVLPASSSDLLPPSYASKMTSMDSAILHFYPIDFQVQAATKIYYSECPAMLPSIDATLLKFCLKKLRLSKEEKSRNTLSTQEKEFDAI